MSTDTRTTINGYTHDDIAASGKANPDSKIGVYAVDVNSYYAFPDVFERAVLVAHNLTDYSAASQPSPSDFAVPHTPGQRRFPVLRDPKGAIKTFRVRTARNILYKNEQQDVFPARNTTADRTFIAEKILKACAEQFEGFSFPRVPEADESGDSAEVKAIKDKQRLMWLNTDPYSAAAGVYREWPQSRHVFAYKGQKGQPLTSDATETYIWINEEDHMRVYTLGKTLESLEDTFGSVATVLQSLEKSGIQYAHDPKLGYITSCPSNIGTGLRFSAHIQLPALGQHEPETLKALCKELDLSIRGTRGENTDVEGWIYDISNKHRFGKKESEYVKHVVDGLQALLDKEEEVAKKHGIA